MSSTAAEDVENTKRPAAPFQTESFRQARPEIVGSEEPEPPFPISLAGLVQKGFGRGGKDLGCPTANLPDESIKDMTAIAKTGVYYGYAQVLPPADKIADFEKEALKVQPMVMSMGWNPFYDNKQLTAEIHIMYPFKRDFYEFEMRVIVLGYIRPELNYTTKEALIDDIKTDIQVALRCLERPGYQKYASDSHFELERGVAL